MDLLQHFTTKWLHDALASYSLRLVITRSRYKCIELHIAQLGKQITYLDLVPVSD